MEHRRIAESENTNYYDVDNFFLISKLSKFHGTWSNSETIRVRIQRGVFVVNVLYLAVKICANAKQRNHYHSPMLKKIKMFWLEIVERRIRRYMEAIFCKAWGNKGKIPLRIVAVIRGQTTVIRNKDRVNISKNNKLVMSS